MALDVVNIRVRVGPRYYAKLEPNIGMVPILLQHIGEHLGSSKLLIMDPPNNVGTFSCLLKMLELLNCVGHAAATQIEAHAPLQSLDCTVVAIAKAVGPEAIGLDVDGQSPGPREHLGVRGQVHPRAIPAHEVRDSKCLCRKLARRRDGGDGCLESKVVNLIRDLNDTNVMVYHFMLAEGWANTVVTRRVDAIVLWDGYRPDGQLPPKGLLLPGHRWSGRRSRTSKEAA
jgi:hypothetical protein